MSSGAVDKRVDNMWITWSRHRKRERERGDTHMTTALDIAKYVLARRPGYGMSGKRLQKLVYFCDVWHTTALDRALFDDAAEAWDNGPVYNSIWVRTRYAPGVSDSSLNDLSVPALDDDTVATLDAVLDYYDQFSDQQLIDLAHEEGSPWDRVYVRRQNNVIERESMRQYYSGAIARNEARPPLPVTVYSYVSQEDMDDIESELNDATPAPGLISMLMKAKTG